MNLSPLILQMFFDPSQYREPIKNPEHVHLENNKWHGDINYKTKRETSGTFSF